MDLDELAVTGPVPEDAAEWVPGAPEDTETAPECGNCSGQAGTTEKAQEPAETARKATGKEKEEPVKVAGGEKEKTEKGKGKKVQTGQEPVFVDRKFISAAFEDARKTATAAGPPVLPESVVNHYRQFGLNEEAIRLIFQAQPADMPSKPVPAPPAPPVKTGKKPGG